MSQSWDTIGQNVEKYGKLLKCPQVSRFSDTLIAEKDLCHFLDDYGFCPKEIGGVIPKIRVFIVDTPTM
jgi:hypothetical protein